MAAVSAAMQVMAQDHIGREHLNIAQITAEIRAGVTLEEELP